MSLEDRLYPLLRLYAASPRWLQRSAGLAYRCLPRTIRFGGEFPAFERLARSLEDASPDAIAEVQLLLLRDTLQDAAKNVTWYRRRFAESGFDPSRLASFNDLRRLPLLEKGDIQQHLAELVSDAVPESNRLYITTGGSTGVPVGFHLQKGVSRPKEQAFLEAMWSRAGYTTNSRLAVVRGHVTSSSASGRISTYDATRDWLMLSSYHLTEERMPEYLAELRRFRPDLLHAYPSAALLIADYVTKHGEPLGIPLRGCLCGSEQMTDPQKAMVERALECRVYRWYGHSERVVLAGEGRTSPWLYFFPTYGFVEFGEPDDEGLREVIGTSFHNRAMPLIRYRTGDYVRLVEGADLSRREFPWAAAFHVAGRGQEFLVSRTARKISLTAFNMHDSVFDGLVAVQFFQDAPGRAEFRYIAAPSFDPSRLARIEAQVREKLGDDFTLSLKQVTEVEKTPRGKHRWLVSTLS